MTTCHDKVLLILPDNSTQACFLTIHYYLNKILLLLTNSELLSCFPVRISIVFCFTFSFVRDIFIANLVRFHVRSWYFYHIHKSDGISMMIIKEV